MAVSEGSPIERISAGAPAGVIGPWTVVTPVLSDVQCNSQQGGELMAQGSVSPPASGTDALVFLAASGWATTVGSISATLELGSRSAPTSVFVNDTSSHLALLRRRVFVPRLPLGPNSVSVTAGTGTVTDYNDRVNVTVVQRGASPKPFHVRRERSGPAASATSITSTPFPSQGGTLLISAAATGYSTSASQMTGMTISVDGQPIGVSQLYANEANSHQSFVPVDLVVVDISPGSHAVALAPQSGTTVDTNDFYSLTVVELLCPPSVMTATQVLANATCSTQGGGNTMASGTFASSGGTLVVAVSVSGFAAAENTLLQASIQIDNKEVGTTELYANRAQTHLCLTGNDVVATSVGAGNHTIGLIASSSTKTDYNDRCSITVIEVAKVAP